MIISGKWFGWYNKELKSRRNVPRFKLVVCIYICGEEAVVRLFVEKVQRMLR